MRWKNVVFCKDKRRIKQETISCDKSNLYYEKNGMWNIGDSNWAMFFIIVTNLCVGEF